jgi:hypothetical protein
MSAVRPEAEDGPGQVLGELLMEQWEKDWNNGMLE